LRAVAVARADKKALRPRFANAANSPLETRPLPSSSMTLKTVFRSASESTVLLMLSAPRTSAETCHHRGEFIILGTILGTSPLEKDGVILVK
jgi:hypothetical protein